MFVRRFSYLVSVYRVGLLLAKIDDVCSREAYERFSILLGYHVGRFIIFGDLLRLLLYMVALKGRLIVRVGVANCRHGSRRRVRAGST